MDNSPTLIVLAAGMGSRYGGLKQLEPMGPHGETLLDYSVYDAIQAGFKKVLFIIRPDIEDPFRKTIGKRYSGRVELDYAFQELDDLPPGYKSLLPQERSKPWGTAHALYAARHKVTGNFAVINADDFYGSDGYQVLSRYFTKCSGANLTPLCMVAYPLDHTLSRHGAVNRGICEVDSGHLLSVEEFIDIERDREGTILGTNGKGTEVQLDPQTPVSMNFWGFSDAIFPLLAEHFEEFLKYHGQALTEEFFIPSFVDALIISGTVTCDVLPTAANWFGVTYPGDRPFVQEHLLQLIHSGSYPSPLLD